jgi:hypothetical protein
MEGIPQLYFNQLNVIAQHLTQKPTVQTTVATIPPDQLQSTDCTAHNGLPDLDPPPDADRGKFLKLKELKQRSDWPEWRQSRFKMLDQYHNHGMFSAPSSRRQRTSHAMEVLPEAMRYSEKQNGMQWQSKAKRDCDPRAHIRQCTRCFQ